MTHGELFAGISGFGVGFARSGIETVWRVENDPHCQRLLRSHYPDTLLLGDVKDCGAHNLPPVDIISFGSPCQDLSVAGKRGGFAGERSGLFFEAIRIIRELRPTIAVWENVGGAQSSYRGRDFAVAIQALAESGAMDIGWAVLDARWFGVAQRRRRVFIVADFGGRRAAQILAIPHGLRGDTPPSRETGQDVAGTLGGGAGSRGWASDIAYALNGKQGNRYDGESETFIFDWQSGGDVRHNVSTEHSSALQASQTPAVFSIRTAQTDSNGIGVQEHQAHTPDGAQQAVAFSVNQRREGRLRDVHGSLNGEQSGTQVDGVLTFQSRIARNGRGQPSDIAPALRGSHEGATADSKPLVFIERGRKSGRSVETQDELAYALTNPATGGRTDSRQLLQGMQVRRLTPTECERLMSHEDGWTAGFADSVRYGMLGNGVVVNVAAWLGQQIVEAL